jgi:hypothetical protein
VPDARRGRYHVRQVRAETLLHDSVTLSGEV